MTDEYNSIYFQHHIVVDKFFTINLFARFSELEFIKFAHVAPKQQPTTKLHFFYSTYF